MERAEAYEGTSPTFHTAAAAGPSRLPYHAGNPPGASKSTPSLLFDAPSTSPLQSPHIPLKTRRAQITEEEGVEVPNLSSILGIHDDDDHYAIAQTMSNPLKMRVYMLLEEPSSGREAFYIHVTVTGLILFSAIMTTFSTLPAFHSSNTGARFLFAMDVFLVVVFTIEYSARFFAHSDTWRQLWRWGRSFISIIDLLAILPFYVELALQSDTGGQFRWSILRVFRLLRVFRSFAHQSQLLLTIEVMFVAIRRSRDALGALLFFIFLIVLLFSTLIYFLERGTWDNALGQWVDVNGDVSQFTSVISSSYFVISSISTVGYGDMVPVTFFGKLVTVPLLIFGLLLIALPSFVLGRQFAVAWDSLASGQNVYQSALTTSARPSVDIPTARKPIETARTSRSVSPQPPAQGLSPSDARDLCNTKLAQNQLVLLDQIESLKKMMRSQAKILESQGEALHQLLSSQPARRIPNGGTVNDFDGRRSLEEKQFDLGAESDDEDNDNKR